MTTTWAGFLAGIRSYLQDTSQTNPKYSDELIYLYTCDAIRDYSQWFPKVTRVEIANVDGGYALPEDFGGVITIEDDNGAFLKKRLARPGYKYRTLTNPTRYWVNSEGIRLNSSTTNAIYLTYRGSHDLPASADDTTFVFSIPDRDMELISIYVRAQCLEQTRSRQANLDRFKRRGERDDNPLIYETSSLMDEYLAKVAERYTGGARYLYLAD